MKKILSASLILSLILTMSVFLSGCGGPETLEEYINENKEIQSDIDSFSSSGMTVDITGNTLTYTYAYTQTFEGETLDLMKSELEKTMGSMESTFQQVGDTLEEDSGISGITVKVVYKDAADNELFVGEY